MGHTDTLFCFCDLDVGPMTLIQEFDLDILKVYLHTRMKFLGQGFQKLEDAQDRHTRTHIDRTHYKAAFAW